MRPRVILFSLAAAVIAALVILSLADQLLVDYLWYGRLGFGGVFNTTVGSEISDLCDRMGRRVRRDSGSAGWLQSAPAATANGCTWCAAPRKSSR